MRLEFNTLLNMAAKEKPNGSDSYLPRHLLHESIESYFRDFFEENKRRDPRKTFEYWAEELRWPTSLLNEIIRGHRTMPWQKIIQFAEYFRLDVEVTEHLLCLVGLKQKNLTSRKKARQLLDLYFNRETVNEPQSDRNWTHLYEAPAHRALRRVAELTESQAQELKLRIFTLRNLIKFFQNQAPVDSGPSVKLFYSLHFVESTPTSLQKNSLNSEAKHSGT